MTAKVCCDCLDTDDRRLENFEQFSSKSDEFRGKVSSGRRKRSLLDCLKKLRYKPCPADLEESVKNGVVPAAKVRYSKKLIRRSSALVKSRKLSEETPKSNEESPCCVGSDGSRINGQENGTRVSQSRGKSTFLTVSRPKTSANWRRKFPCVTRLSSAADSPRSRTSASGAPIDRFERLSRRLTRTHVQELPRSKLAKTRFRSQETACRPCHRYSCCIVRAASSSDEDEDVDYQVPIRSSRCCGNLVPSLSHVTVRICSADSSSSHTVVNCNDRESNSSHVSTSEESLHDLEERVRRRIRDTCCCDASEDSNLVRKSETYRTGSSHRPGKCGKPLFRLNHPHRLPCSKTLSTKQNICNSKRSPRPRVKAFCCGCRKISGLKKSKDSSDISFRKLDERLKSARASESQCGVPKSQRPVCQSGMKRPRKVDTKRCSNSATSIVLTASQYGEFKRKCERIRESMRMRDEKNQIFSSADREPDCDMTLNDLCPDLPPLQHWSEFEDQMQRVTDEYKTLKSCLDSMESEAEKPAPACFKEKRVTRCYPSGTEFTFGVKRVPDQSGSSGEEGCCDCPEPEVGRRFYGRKDRSMWFEKIRREKESCCSFSDDAEAGKVEVMNAREADLIKTLETFCEKIKRIKSEFQKPLTTCCLDNENGSFSRSARYSGRRNKRCCCGKLKAKKLLIFPPEGEDGPPLTLMKNSSNVSCRVKGDAEKGFQYNVTYVQSFVSSIRRPGNENHQRCVDSG